MQTHNFEGSFMQGSFPDVSTSMFGKGAPGQDVIHDGPAVLFKVQRRSNNASPQLVALHIRHLGSLHRGACCCGSCRQCCTAQGALPACSCACSLTKGCGAILSHNMVVVGAEQLCAWTARYSGNLSCEHDTLSHARQLVTVNEPCTTFPRELHCKPYYKIHWLGAPCCIPWTLT